jgi:hydroxylamine reductase
MVRAEGCGHSSYTAPPWLKLAPTLPAFVSPNVLNFLVENFNIGPITTADADLKAILG